MSEVWLIAAGFDNYDLSDHGRVRRRTGGRGVRAGRILKPQPNPKGYVTVTLWQSGVGTRRTIHTLVWDTFVGDRPAGMEVNHINGVKADCALTNLELGTSTHNKRHASENGLSAFGLRNGATKLRADQVVAILEAVATGESQRRIAARFGISQGHVSGISNGKKRRREYALAIETERGQQ